MAKIAHLTALASALVLSVGIAQATTWYVNLTDGSEDNDGLSPSTPKRYLKTTVTTTAAAGDTVFVIGTYGTGETIEIKKRLLVATRPSGSPNGAPATSVAASASAAPPSTSAASSSYRRRP